MDRRTFVKRSSLSPFAFTWAPPWLQNGAGTAQTGDDEAKKQNSRGGFWDGVRGRFQLDPEYVHLACMLIATHPDIVRKRVEEERQALNRQPALYLTGRNIDEEQKVRRAAGEYLGTSWQEIALTGSTTMGLAMLYSGIQAKEGQEFITTRLDHDATRESLRLRARRSHAVYKEIDLPFDPGGQSPSEIVDKIAASLTEKSRVLALTWVHSSNGLKIPVQEISKKVAEHNAGRDPSDRVLLCIDGVHGLGVEDVSIPELGCDFFVAGCHKWLFGPRGTGLIWGDRKWWPLVTPVVPTFSGTATHGSLMTPGGFHAFEHRWAVAEAFAFHQEIGKSRIAERTRSLNQDFKKELSNIKGVRVVTPRSPSLSSGIICFEIDGKTPREVVTELEAHKIIASTSPYSKSFARVSPGIINNEEDVETALAATRKIAG